MARLYFNVSAHLSVELTHALRSQVSLASQEHSEIADSQREETPHGGL